MVRRQLKSMLCSAIDSFFRDVPGLAKKPPASVSAIIKPNPVYILLRSFTFNRQMWHGYEHRMTKGERAHGQGKTGEGGEDRTWEFCLAE